VVPTQLVRAHSLLSLFTQMLISSATIESPRNNVLPTIWVLLSLNKLTHKINNHRGGHIKISMILFCFILVKLLYNLSATKIVVYLKSLTITNAACSKTGN
jgi:hypothetical protein